MARPKKERLSKQAIDTALHNVVQHLIEAEANIFFNKKEKGIILQQTNRLNHIRGLIAESIIVP